MKKGEAVFYPPNENTLTPRATADRCPFCAAEVRPSAVIVHRCLKSSMIIERWDVWQSRPIEDELRRTIEKLTAELAEIRAGSSLKRTPRRAKKVTDR